MKKFFNKLLNNIKLFFSGVWTSIRDSSLGILFVPLLILIVLLILLCVPIELEHDTNEIIVNTTNLAQVNDVETSFYSDNKNLASPDLGGKDYLGDGVYRLFNSYGLTFDYNVYSGVFNLNGTTDNGWPEFITFDLPNEEMYLKMYHISGSTSNSAYPSAINRFTNNPQHIISSQQMLNGYYINTNTRTISLVSTTGVIYTNYQFKIQIEKGDIATDYEVPFTANKFVNEPRSPNYFDYANIAEYVKEKRNPYNAFDHLPDGVFYTPSNNSPYSISSLRIIFTRIGDGSPLLGYEDFRPGDTYFNALINNQQFMGISMSVKYSYKHMGVKVGSDFYYLGVGNVNFSLSNSFMTFTDYQGNTYVITDEEVGYGSYASNSAIAPFDLYFSNDPYFAIGESSLEYNEGFKAGKESGYNEGYRESREFYGYYDNGQWLTADTWGEIQHDIGASSNLNVWQIMTSTFFGTIGAIGAIEILPGVSLWYFVAFPLIIGIIKFIAGGTTNDAKKGKGDKK